MSSNQNESPSTSETHHDVTLQQQRRFHRHTQTSASSALKVAANTHKLLNCHRRFHCHCKWICAGDKLIQPWLFWISLLTCKGLEVENEAQRFFTSVFVYFVCLKLMKEATNTPELIWHRLTRCPKCRPAAWPGRSSGRGSNLKRETGRDLDIAGIVSMKTGNVLTTSTPSGLDQLIKDKQTNTCEGGGGGSCRTSCWWRKLIHTRLW